MNYRRNILAGISGIVISIGTLSTSASANPKSFIFEGQILASVKKLIKYRVKADQFADDAEASAKQANTNAAKLEVCCSELPEADEASEYANQAEEAAISARDKSDRASSTNKSSKAKDLKDKAKGFASQAEEAAEKVTTLLNDALESLKEEFTPRVSVALDLAESSAKRASEAVSTAKDCCSEQEIDGDISDIEDAEEAAEEAAKAASEAKSFEKALSYSDAERFTIELELAAAEAANAASEAIRTANKAKRYPDDFSDMKRRCQRRYFTHQNGKIGAEIYNKKWEKKVRYRGFGHEEFFRKYC